MKGVELTASLGLNTWAAFAGTDERAHAAGDVAMTAQEVNPAIRELPHGGIDVVAVHNHMLDEELGIFFLQYWGNGPAEKLAQTVREAFDRAKGPVRWNPIALGIDRSRPLPDRRHGSIPFDR